MAHESYPIPTVFNGITHTAFENTPLTVRMDTDAAHPSGSADGNNGKKASLAKLELTPVELQNLSIS